jgi:hypothetical protein
MEAFDFHARFSDMPDVMHFTGRIIADTAVAV